MRMFVALGVALVVLAGAAVLALQNREDEERDPGSGPESIARIDVGAITAVPDRWFRENVQVTGEAVPVDEERFVLRGRGGAIVVSPEPGALRGEVEEGERVTVNGTVYGFNRLQVQELERLLSRPPTPAALREAPTELESPYLEATLVRARR